MKNLFEVRLLLLLGLLLVSYQGFSQNNSWCVVMTQSVRAESYDRKPHFPSTYIDEQWKKGHFISEMTYDGEQWYVVTGALNYKQQAYRYDKTFPSDWVDQKWKEDFDITDVEYGAGVWVVVMSKGAGLTGESWGKRGSFEEIKEFIRTKWNDAKDIIDIAYGNGEWVAILAHGADYDKQVYNWGKSFPTAWVQEKQNAGYNITTVTYGEGVWVVVMSKFTRALSERFQTSSTFPSAFIDQQWKAGKRISFLHYNYEKDEAVSFDEFFNAGLQAANSEDHHLAIYYYNEALKINPNHATCYNNLAWSKYLLGQCSGALADIDRSIRLGASEYSYHTRGAIYLCLGRCRDAVNDFNSALAVAATKEAYYYGDRAAARSCLGDYADAIADYKQAIAKDPNNLVFRSELKKVEDKTKVVAAPTITWDHPYKSFTSTTDANFEIKGCIHSDGPIASTKIYVNGKTFDSRGFGVDENCTESVKQVLKLVPGRNEVEIVVTTAKHVTRSEKRIIEYKAQSSGNYHALLIAVGDYDDYSIKDLTKPTVDAEELRKTLTTYYTFEPGDVHLLKNPTKDEILNKLIYLQDRLGSNDNLLIYYSGHGVVKNDVGYWLPKNAQKDNRAQWLSNAELRDYTNNMKAKHTLIIADACFSGSIISGGYRDFEELACEEMGKVKSRRAMTSGANTVVPDDSVFFKYLIQKLKENNTSCLSAENLYSKIKPAVIVNSPNNHVPQFGVLPMAGDEGGNFVFKRR